MTSLKYPSFVTGMSPSTRLVAAVACACVGVVSLFGLYSSTATSGKPGSKKRNAKGKGGKKRSSSKAVKAGGGGKKSSSKKGKSLSPTSSGSRKPTREEVLRLEAAAIEEFKAFLPQLAEEEGRLVTQARNAGAIDETAVKRLILERLAETLENHLQRFKKQELAKAGISEKKHDEEVIKLVEAGDDDMDDLVQKTKTLWNAVFGDQTVEVPDHIDEATAIEFVTRTYRLVQTSMEEARASFVRETTPEALAAFHASLQSNPDKQRAFNQRFQHVLIAKKAELRQEFGLESEEQFMAIVKKYNESPAFHMAAQRAKAEVDAFFQQQGQ